MILPGTSMFKCVCLEAPASQQLVGSLLQRVPDAMPAMVGALKDFTVVLIAWRAAWDGRGAAFDACDARCELLSGSALG